MPKFSKRTPLGNLNYQYVDQLGNLQTLQVLPCDNNLSVNNILQNSAVSSIPSVQNFEVLANVEVPTDDLNSNNQYQILSNENLNYYVQYLQDPVQDGKILNIS